MTSGTGTCSVSYDQAGNTNYDAATQVTERSTRRRPPDDHRVHARAGQCRVQHELRCPGQRARRRRHLLERGRLLEQRQHLHDEQRHRHLHRQLRPGRQQQLQRRAAGHRTVNAQKAARRSRVTRTRQRRAVYNTELHRRGDRRVGGRRDFSSSGACSNAGATFTMTSGTGTCSVSTTRPATPTTTRRRRSTETVNAQKADQTITVTTHAPASAVYDTSFSVAATAASGPRHVLERRRLLELRRHVHDDERHRPCAVSYDQAGDTTTTPRRRYRDGRPRRRRPDDHRVHTSRRSRLQHELHGGGAAAPGGTSSRFSSARRLLELGPRSR